VSCGTVFAGAVGAPVRRTFTVVGDAVNLASRLAERADWGQVLLAESAAKAVADRFSVEGLGRPRIKGRAEPVRVYQLRGPRLLGAAQGLPRGTEPSSEQAAAGAADQE
jgi:adenylate cyclase